MINDNKIIIAKVVKINTLFSSLSQEEAKAVEEVVVVDNNSNLLFTVCGKGLYKTGENAIFVPTGTTISLSEVTNHLLRSRKGAPKETGTIKERNFKLQKKDTNQVSPDGLLIKYPETTKYLTKIYPILDINEDLIEEYIKTGSILMPSKYFKKETKKPSFWSKIKKLFKIG